MGIFSRFKKEEMFYYPGCRTKIKHKESLEAYRSIFSRMGIELKTFDKHFCCGLLPLELGYEQDARKLARKNLEFFKADNVKKLITNCPACYKMMKQDYPQMLPDWDIEIVDAWDLIRQKLEEKPRLIKNKADEKITFNDSCYLGMHCGIYDSPRKILQLIGYEIIEMYDSKEKSICAGGCGGMEITNPKTAKKIAFQRILQAKRAKVNKMIVTSFIDYDLLKDNSEGIKVMELSEVLADALGMDINIQEQSSEDILETANEETDDEYKEEEDKQDE
jgi:Fe-S oxidoreductase